MKRIFKPFSMIVFLLMLIFGFSNVKAQYVMRDLGTLGGNYSEAWGISDSGQVVGVSRTSSLPLRAFLWDKVHGMQDLGTLGGMESMAYGINNSGQVVGGSYPSDEAPGEHAFLWDKVHGMQDLGTLGGTDGFALGINNSGQVVGYSTTSSGHVYAVLWEELSPQGPAKNLIGQVEVLVTTGILTPNQSTGLIAKLDEVIAKLDAGNTTAACNQVNAFINQVKGFINSGKLTAQQGAPLITTAVYIRTKIGC